MDKLKKIKNNIKHSYITNKKQWQTAGLIALTSFIIVLLLGTTKTLLDVSKTPSEPTNPQQIEEQQKPDEKPKEQTETETQEEQTSNETESKEQTAPQEAVVDPNTVQEVVPDNQNNNQQTPQQTQNNQNQTQQQQTPQHTHNWVEITEEVKVVDAEEIRKTFKTITFTCSACDNTIVWDEKTNYEEDIEKFQAQLNEHIENHLYTGTDNAYGYTTTDYYEEVVTPEKFHYEQKGTGKYKCTGCNETR